MPRFIIVFQYNSIKNIHVARISPLTDTDYLVRPNCCLMVYWCSSNAPCGHQISRASKVADMLGATGMAPVGLMRAASGAGGYFFGGLLELGGTVFLYAGNICTPGFCVFTCIWLLMDHMLLQVRRKGKWSAIPSTPHFHRCHRWQRPERGGSEVWNLDQWIRTKAHKDLINHINLDGSKLSCGNSKKSSLYFRLMQYLSRKF